MQSQRIRYHVNAEDCRTLQEIHTLFAWKPPLSFPRVTPKGSILCDKQTWRPCGRADTALWLHNKLSTDDSWSGSSLRSLLTQDVLRNIPECFHRLETQVKVKLLMAFLHLPRRVIEETNSEMSEIFEIGSQDRRRMGSCFYQRY